jgi:hypothetical protein
MCIRLTLPIMSMVITLFALLKLSAGQLSTLVNFELAAPRLHGQFSAGANIAFSTERVPNAPSESSNV